MTGFLYSYQMAELSGSRESFQIVFPRTRRKMFPSRTTKSKTSAGSLSEKTHWFLTAYSCNRDKIAGNLIRLVPLDFLKDERQCQTLKTITSCLYKQPLVSLDIKQSLGHLLSMPIGLAPALSPWLARKVTGSGMRHLVLQKQSPNSATGGFQKPPPVQPKSAFFWSFSGIL